MSKPVTAAKLQKQQPAKIRTAKSATGVRTQEMRTERRAVCAESGPAVLIRLGQLDGMGVNFSIYAQNATKIELCLFDSVDSEKESVRIALPERMMRSGIGISS